MFTIRDWVTIAKPTYPHRILHGKIIGIDEPFVNIKLLSGKIIFAHTDDIISGIHT